MEMHYNKVVICGVDTSKLTVLTEKEKQEFIDSIQNTANGDRQGDHFRTAPRRRAMPREKILPR